MTNRQLDNRVLKIQDLEAEIKRLEAMADSLRNEIKADMASDEVNTGRFIIRWKEVISKRLDSTALKKALPDVWQSFSKETSSKRFTINKAA